MPEPDVFVFVPVYRGAELLPETLRSIRAQTHERFRVLVSIDDADRACAEAARAVIGEDPRFEIVLQPERRGWPGNFNWLVERCDRPFLTYWQQDDLASTDYLAALRSALLADETAAVAYADVQWFGARTERAEVASFTGSPPARVLEQFETLSYIPLRGLIRSAMLPAGTAISPSRDRSSQAEFGFLAGLAAAGGFTRVEGPLAFKRAHAGAVHGEHLALPAHQRRREAAHTAAQVLAIVRAAAGTPAVDGALLATILDRLAIHRPGRAFFFEPEPTVTGARDLSLQLADEAGIDLGDPRWEPAAPTGLERPVHARVTAAIAAERERAAALRAPDPPLAARLGWGWHPLEPWGAWARGEHASVELGAWPGGRLRLEGVAFAPAGPVRIGWSADGDDPQWRSYAHDDPVVLEADLPPGTPRIHLHLPDAVSPAQANLSADPRPLSLGLRSVGAPSPLPGAPGPAAGVRRVA